MALTSVSSKTLLSVLSVLIGDLQWKTFNFFDVSHVQLPEEEGRPSSFDVSPPFDHEASKN